MSPGTFSEVKILAGVLLLWASVTVASAQESHEARTAKGTQGPAPAIDIPGDGPKEPATDANAESFAFASGKDHRYHGVVTGVLPLPDSTSLVPGAAVWVEGPILMEEVSSHLGRGTQSAEAALLFVSASDYSLNVIVDSIATAANGDELSIRSALVAAFPDWTSLNGFAYTGEYTIDYALTPTGGTGRFTVARGSGEITGAAFPTVTTEGALALSFTHTFSGSLAYRASSRASGKGK